MSSAQLHISQVVKKLKMSSIKILKRRGPSIEPFVTPLLISTHAMNLLLTVTFCILLFKQLRVKVVDFRKVLYAFNFERSKEWFSTSNAFDKDFFIYLFILYLTLTIYNYYYKKIKQLYIIFCMLIHANCNKNKTKQVYLKRKWK